MWGTFETVVVCRRVWGGEKQKRWLQYIVFVIFSSHDARVKSCWLHKEMDMDRLTGVGGGVVVGAGEGAGVGEGVGDF